MPAVLPRPNQRITAPAVIASAAKSSPCGVESRPDGIGRPAVRAMRASRRLSWTWFSAEAPLDSSMTPVSTSNPWSHGKSGPRGARSMNPAPAETIPSSTVPNFDSSAYAPTRAETETEETVALDAAIPGLCPWVIGSRGGNAGLGEAGAARGSRQRLAPDPGAGGDPHHFGPEGVAD